MAMLAFAVLMRLLFDVALYGYYLAWAAVALLALDLLAGRLRAGGARAEARRERHVL